MTGAHVFAKGRIPRDVDGREIMEDLDMAGHVEIYGCPVTVGTMWLHIEDTPRYTVPEARDVIDELVDEFVDARIS